MDPKRRLKSLDIYRKVPLDLTETTASGACITVLSVLMLVLLAMSELRSLFTPVIETTVVVNSDNSETIRMHMDLTLMGIGCEYVSVDVENKLGVAKMDLQTTTLIKFSNGTRVGTVPAAAKKRAPAELKETLVPRANTSLEVASEKELEALVAAATNGHVLVNFYSSKSAFSDHIYLKFDTAAIEAAKLGAKTRFASVDCLRLVELCVRERVQAYPSIRLLGRHSGAEAYVGLRDIDALARVALELPTTEFVRLQDAAQCRVAGYLDLARVPSRISIHAHSTNADLDPAMMISNHMLHSLSFGSAATIDSSQSPPRKFDVNGANKLAAFTHYLKIVSRTLVNTNNANVTRYEYALSTDAHVGSYNNNVHRVDFVLDISPLQIVETQRTKDVIQGVTAVMALLGGVFSASFMLESIGSLFWCWTSELAKQA